MSPFRMPALDANGALRWIRDWTFPVRDAVGLVIRMAGVAEDVTKRRQLEMKLRQAQKMEAIGPLTIGVAHDFNNLLSVISGHSELLEMSLLADSPGLDSVDQIQIGRAAERGAALIRQLLAFSRQQVLELQVFDLNVLVADTEKILRRLIGENVRLITILQPGLSQVRDPASSTKSS